MLTSSRTWPSILQKTMAVVQLRFDGKYAYSTIANINHLQKLQNQISITSCDQVEDDLDVKNKNLVCECDHKCDLQSKCGSHAMSSRHMNGHSRASPVSKASLYDRTPSAGTKGSRKRSESIKVENWDFIYREKPFLDVPNDERNGVPK